MEYDSKKFLFLGVFIIMAFTFIKPKRITYTYTSKTAIVKEDKLDSTKVELLARLIYSEAGGEDYEGQLAVGNVVLNRMERKNKSLKYIIYQKGQFDGIRSSRFKYKYKSDSRYHLSKKAAKMLLLGLRILPKTVEFFHNPETSTDTSWTKYLSRYKYKNIGNHLFCHNPNLVI